MTLCIKTGMESEYEVARAYFSPNVLMLTGTQTVESLSKSVPGDCTGIISFGLCGGLAPQALIGQAFIYDAVVTPDWVYPCDPAWVKALFTVTRYYERKCWSDGVMNTANTIAQRAAIFAKTGCWVIDDESQAVAQFAKLRNIALGGLRVVSDGAEDNLPPAVINALNPDGTDDLWAVVSSVVSDPAQIPDLVKTAGEYEVSIAELRRAAIDTGPFMQWNLV